MLMIIYFNTAVFGLLGALHGYWAGGGQWAAGAVLPTLPDGTAPFRPAPALTLAVAAGLWGAALLTVANTGLFSRWLAPGWVTAATYLLAAVLLLRAFGDFRFVGLTKRVTSTAFAANDTAYYTPLCAALGLGTLVLAYFD